MDANVWIAVLIGLGVTGWIAAMVYLARTTSKPLPVLDPTPRTATVTHFYYLPERGDLVGVQYVGTGGETREAYLVDVIHDSSLDRFAIGSRWEIIAFREPIGRVFLSTAHDDVVRDGYNLDGVRLGGESGPSPEGPGSRFLHSKKMFTQE